MTKNEFEMAAKEQNRRRDEEVAAARRGGTVCAVVTMFAFGGIPYCTTHRVVGPCPYAREAQESRS